MESQSNTYAPVVNMVSFSCRSRSCKAHLMPVAWLHTGQCYRRLDVPSCVCLCNQIDKVIL